MLIAIEHEIHDASAFQACAQEVFPLPSGLRIYHFLPATDMSRAACLYEAASVDELRDYIDGTLGDASTQRYFPVDEANAIGVPERVPAGRAEAS
jgi:hypothetical protein